MSTFYAIPALVLALFCSFDTVNSHGRLMEPPSRSSLWRLEEFQKYKPEINYDDNQLFCGSKDVSFHNLKKSLLQKSLERFEYYLNICT